MILNDILEILKSDSENNAYRIGVNNYTYNELYKYVCNLYWFLLEKNRSKKPVVIYGSKEIYMKASFLACSFAGMPYVPIDINIPKDRVDEIIKQINPDVIIGDLEKDVRAIKSNDIYSIMNNNNFNGINKIYMKPQDTYYIIFTSGTTGKPKGVEITYSNLNSCIKWLKDITNAKNEIILNQANFSFDLSVADLYLSLVTESEHFIINTNNMIDFKKIFNELKTSRVTLAVMTPSFADLFLTDKLFSEELLPELKIIIFCGEKLLKSTVNELYLRFKRLKIINTYGPTECTFAVTSFEIPRNFDEEIPVGIPKNDVDIFVLDDNDKELKDGEKGELLISGESVAKGYINLKTNKFITYKGKSAYKTGDIGYIKNGNIYIIGRKDSQIKYKGYRIELKDIESNIMDLEEIDKVVVLPKLNENKKVEMLIAFVKTKNKTEFDIKKELKKKLPSYMIPKIKIINEFPINKNGKCDEKRLMKELL